MDIHLYMWFCVALVVFNTYIHCHKYHKYHLHQSESLNPDSVLKDVGTVSCNEYTHGILEFYSVYTISYVYWCYFGALYEFLRVYTPNVCLLWLSLFRWCSITSFSYMVQFCHSVRKCHVTPSVWTYYHFLSWHYTIFTFYTKK